MEKGLGVGCFEKAQKWEELQDDQALVTTQVLKKTMRGGKIFCKWEIEEKLERSDEEVDRRDEIGLSRKITRTEDCGGLSGLGALVSGLSPPDSPHGMMGLQSGVGSRTGVQFATNFLLP